MDDIIYDLVLDDEIDSDAEDFEDAADDLSSDEGDSDAIDLVAGDQIPDEDELI